MCPSKKKLQKTNKKKTDVEKCTFNNISILLAYSMCSKWVLYLKKNAKQSTHWFSVVITDHDDTDAFI